MTQRNQPLEHDCPRYTLTLGQVSTRLSALSLLLVHSESGPAGLTDELVIVSTSLL